MDSIQFVTVSVAALDCITGVPVIVSGIHNEKLLYT